MAGFRVLDPDLDMVERKRKETPTEQTPKQTIAKRKKVQKNKMLDSNGW